jgi:hypothetical protein
MAAPPPYVPLKKGDFGGLRPPKPHHFLFPIKSNMYYNAEPVAAPHVGTRSSMSEGVPP